MKPTRFKLLLRHDVPSHVEVGQVDSAGLHYESFLGDILLEQGEVDFSAFWGWIPLLDFVHCVTMILDSVSVGSKERYEFTESDAWLEFDRVDIETVCIKSEYAPGSILVPFADLRDLVGKAGASLMAEIETRCPGIVDNKSYQEIRLEIQSGPLE